MNTLNKLIENSVREHYEKPTNTDEQGSQLSESSNAENNFNKNNQQANGLPDGKAEKRKRKKDDESTDEEELPRRRAITMGQHKRRKRFVTKYQKELEMERKDEQFRAEVFVGHDLHAHMAQKMNRIHWVHCLNRRLFNYVTALSHVFCRFLAKSTAIRSKTSS